MKLLQRRIKMVLVISGCSLKTIIITLDVKKIAVTLLHSKHNYSNTEVSIASSRLRTIDLTWEIS
jgi:hypothetical protein